MFLKGFFYHKVENIYEKYLLKKVSFCEKQLPEKENFYEKHLPARLHMYLRQFGKFLKESNVDMNRKEWFKLVLGKSTVYHGKLEAVSLTITTPTDTLVFYFRNKKIQGSTSKSVEVIDTIVDLLHDAYPDLNLDLDKRPLTPSLSA